MREDAGVRVMVLVLWTKGLAIVVVSVATEYLDLLRQLCIFFTAGFGLLWIWPWAWPWTSQPLLTRHGCLYMPRDNITRWELVWQGMT